MNGLPDILELQKKKQWTWDEFLNITRQLTVDTDGDGLTDIWGFASSDKARLFYSLLHSNNAFLAIDTDIGETVLNFTSHKVIETFKFIRKIVVEDKVAYIASENTSSISQSLDRMLKDNKVAIIDNGTINRNISDGEGRAFYPIGPSSSSYNCTFKKQGYYAVPNMVEYLEEIAIILKELYYFADNTRKTKTYNRKASQKSDSELEFEKFIFETAINNLSFQSEYETSLKPDAITTVIENIDECEIMLKEYEEELQKQIDNYQRTQKAEEKA